MHDDEPKRITLEIEGRPLVVDTLVTLMRFIAECGRLGTTRNVELMVDGDGGGQVGVKVDGLEVPLDDAERDFLFEGQGEGTPALRHQFVEARSGRSGYCLAVDLA